MQENKFDYNQLIGLVLIFVLLGAYFYLVQPTEEERQKAAEEAQKQQQEQVENQNNNQKESTNANALELNKVEVHNSISLEEVSIENEKLAIKISSLGGQITELRMKNQFAYDSAAENHKRPLYLIEKGNNRFNLSFADASGRIVKTENLAFQSSVQKQDSTTIVRMQSKIGTGILEYIYTLKNGFGLKFQIRTEGLKSITTSNEIDLNWDMNAFALEKGRQQELYYTDTHFRIKEDKDIDYDSNDWNEEDVIDWVAFKQQFFATALSFDDGFVKSSGNVVPYEDKNSEFSKAFTFNSKLPVNQSELNYQMEWDFLPLDKDMLEPYESRGYDELIPFGIWGGGGPIAWLNKNFFLNVYKWLSSVGIAAGWVIFLMTIVVKLILSPVMYRQYRQSAMMKVLRPEIDEINEKYKGQENAMKRQQEVMALQRKAGVNMLAGCIPALLQMPLFYALFRFFPNLFDLRGKKFLWAEDLTAYDSIVNLPFDIPFLGSHISLFALLYVVVMVIYFRVSGSLNNFQNSQPPQEGMPDMRFMKYMMYVMPIFFFVFLNNYASGLSLYYLVSNGINIGIVLFIKNVMIDEEKIHAKVQENKAKPKKENRFQRRMQEMMEKAQAQQEIQKKQKKKGKK